jgi:hypothetical protein
MDFVLVLRPDDDMTIGDVFVDGQNRDVWCNSKKPINDSKMYNNGQRNSYPMFTMYSNCLLLISNGTEVTFYLHYPCSSSDLIYSYFFLCEY